MTDRIFIQAAFATAPAVMGVQLRPFSVGHSFLLSALCSPFCCGGKVDQASLVEAVLVCSRSWTDAKALVFEAGLAEAAAALGESVQNQLSELDADAREDWFVGELSVFDEYLGIYSDIPNHFQDKDSKSYRAPWEWHAVRMLCQSGLAGSRAEAWDTTVNEALCWRSVVAEHGGDDSMMKQSDREAKAIEAKELMDRFGGDKDRVAEAIMKSHPRYPFTAADVDRRLLDLPEAARDG